MLQEKDTNETILVQMPFYPKLGVDPILDHTAKELLTGDVLPSKNCDDGFIDFLAIKLCSSNAKQLAKYFELALGFEEIAFRNLETGSRLVASHVVQNGNVTFEFVSTLEMVEAGSINDLSSLRYDEQIAEELITRNMSKMRNALEFDLCDFLSNSSHLTESEGNMHPQLCAVLQKTLNSETNTRLNETYQTNLTKLLAQLVDGYSDFAECSVIQLCLKHRGEGVIDIILQVSNVEAIFNKAKLEGVTVVRYPYTSTDQYGCVKKATFRIPNTEILHTLVEIIDYTGSYLPGYCTSLAPKTASEMELDSNSTPAPKFACIDHCVENYSWNQMMEQASLYARIFGFHKFWLVDESSVFTEKSALRSIVMTLANGKIKLPINEPVHTPKRSQIEEFIHFNGGPGVQHIALRTIDIISTVKALEARGIEFNSAPETYHDDLARRLEHDNVRLLESMESLRKYGILVDYDPKTRNPKSHICHYILQLFTKPLHDRPTLFLEVIQRRHHNGFGKGTFKGLFETIENQQRLRGTLVDSGKPF